MATNVAAQTAVQEVLDRAVTDGGEIGVQVAAFFDGLQVVDAWAGTADPATGRPFDHGTVTTVFSVTKGIASTAVHMLADRGQLDYDAPVASYWPAFGANGKDRVTVAEALSHRAAVPQMPASIGPDDVIDWDRALAAFADLTPMWEPSTEPGYHSLTHGWITGGLIQAVDGRRIDQFVREEMLAPLGIVDDFFLGLPESADARVAPLVMDDKLQGEPTPDPESYRYHANPPVWYPLGRSFNLPQVRRAIVPGAGGIGTATALARIYAAAIGEVDGVRLLTESTMRVASALQTDAWDLVLEAADPKGAGYFLGQPNSPMSGRRSAFGHPGYGGAIAFADPDHRFAFALTKNCLRGDLGGAESVALAAARATRQALGIPEN
ncbi:MAG TPA: serine hydrolase domain-containing protein [Thermomicrobiales bacterium]|jgi:CubicO group peptidase (beta-lactamase class C family)|nr:serine hydrolase domain-containing protein [Thermomicrobiales bacterium]